MDLAAATIVLVAGLIMLGIGLYKRVKNVALGGAVNLLAASLLFPHGGFGPRHYTTFLVIAVLLFEFLKSTFNRAMWLTMRIEALLGLAIIASIWTLELLGSSMTHEVKLGLVGALAIMTTAWIGLILVRVTKEPLGQPSER